jgi:dipeptidyl aminopeptidase/acylaminoacyl peptidase
MMDEKRLGIAGSSYGGYWAGKMACEQQGTA